MQDYNANTAIIMQILEQKIVPKECKKTPNIYLNKTKSKTKTKKIITC